MRPVLIGLLLLPTMASAVPLELSHQGRLFDQLGAPLDGDHDLVVSLYDVPSGGVALWSEALNAESFDAGYFSVTLGLGAALDDTVFDNDDLWMAMTVDGGAELPTRLKISSVPFAIRAQTATNLSGGVVDATEIRINGTTVIDASGTVSVDWSDLTGMPAGFADGFDDEGAGVGPLDAGDIVSGTMDVARLPVGSSSFDVSAGDHAHGFGQITGVASAAQIPNLDASKITAGTIGVGRLPVGTGITNVAVGDHSHTAADVGALPVGTTAADIGALPVGTTAADIGALPAGTTAADIGALPVGTTAADLGGVTAGSAPTIGTSTATCNASIEGQLRYNSGDLEYCDGSDWLSLLTRGGDDGSDAGSPALSCNLLHQGYPALGTGTYWVDPNGGDPSDSFQVYCDMVNDGGGWTRVVGINSGNTQHRNASAVNASGMTGANSFGKFSDTDINSWKTQAFRMTCGVHTVFYDGVINAASVNQKNGCNNTSPTGPFYVTLGWPSHAGLDSYSPSGGSCHYQIYNYTGNGCWQAGNGKAGEVWIR